MVMVLLVRLTFGMGEHVFDSFLLERLVDGKDRYGPGP